MNLLASYHWLREYLDIKETPEQLAARVSLSGPGIEKLYPQNAGFDGIVLGHVKEVGPHPNADKLRIAKVDVGAKSLANIVCGGSNLEANQWVAVALPGAKVKWHGEGELVELVLTEIRGIQSQGMICAANEIGLFDAFPHKDREILDLGKAIPELKAKAGSPIASVLGFSDDVVMDIEVTTNRPDLMGMVGMAREVAAILKRPFTWKPAPKIKPGKQTLDVKIQDKKHGLRYMAVKIDNVIVKESPWWLKQRLLSSGVRPINNIVDITNFVMLELGQPMHAFNAAMVEGDTIRVRSASEGEELSALDGKTYQLKTGQLVIADASKPIAIAGIMGGEHSGVTPATTSIIFEAAAFEPVNVRRTARALNLYSDAQRLFEKGLSVEAPSEALARAVELCLELAGGSVASKVVDIQSEKYKPLKYSITVDEINRLVGIDMKPKEMIDILKRLGFSVSASGKKLNITIPWWRDHDIEDARDLVEEIARMHGYANLPAVYPEGISPRKIDTELIWEDKVRTIAKGAGFTETYTYSFVSKSLMEKCRFDVSKLLKISNPLSEDFEYMRTTLLPSLIQVVAENQETFRQQQLFEVANVYYPTGKTWDNLPDEQLELAAAVLGDDSAWRKAKGFVELTLSELGIEGLVWKPLESDLFWHPTRTVQAFKDGKLVATVGELHPSLATKNKIEGHLALVDIPLEQIQPLFRHAKVYQPIPTFPQSSRDLALLLDRGVMAQDLQNRMRNSSPLLRHVEWFDTYQGDKVPANKKSVAFHLVFGLPDRTLEATEVDQALKDIQVDLQKHFGAEVR